jgi:CRP-like cAMP-binding protein
VTLAERAAQHEYEADALLTQQGDPVSELWIIDGNIELSMKNEAGDDVVLDTLTRADAFGEAALYDEGGRMVSARATEKTRVLAIDGEEFRALVRERPRLAEALIRLLASRLRAATERR